MSDESKCYSSGCPPERTSKKAFVTGQKADRRLADLAKALGHPIRVQIIRILINKKECVCGEIVEDLGVPQSTVSQHLKALKAVGLIRGEIEGVNTCYCLNFECLREVKALVEAI